MDSRHVEADSNHNPNGPAPRRKDDVGGGKANDVVRRAKVAATGLASHFDKQLKRNPYAMLGVACAIGVGVGIVFSSRILRAVVTAAATAGALEITRALVRQYVSRVVAT